MVRARTEQKSKAEGRRIFIATRSSRFHRVASSAQRFNANRGNSIFRLSILLIECFSVMERIVGSLFRGKTNGKQISFCQAGVDL
jgi:hypothetical protein